MRKLLAPLALSGLLALAACTDPYGNYDPVATGLLGAGVGAVAGAAIVAASQPRRTTYVYRAPAYRPHYGYGYGRPVYRSHGYGGWGHRPRHYW